MKSLSFLLIFLLHFVEGIAQSQPYTIKDQGLIRTYLIHLPSGYEKNKSYPLVVNLHGLNSNGAEQELYSRFDSCADIHGFIVVYPNAVGEAWKIGSDEDVIFISNLIDTIQAKFSTNNCLFITGMSMGGFMTYKLACTLQNKITAMAVVSGNMSIPLQNTCTPTPGIPVMHFHGTNDPLVNYEGSFGIAPVETTIQWWVNQNKCMTLPKTTMLPDLITADHSTVTKYEYKNMNSNVEVTFYKIIQGGHTWPGAKVLLPYGNTNQDIDASAEIAAYFKRYCLGTTIFPSSTPEPEVKFFPNPANQEIQIKSHRKYLSPTIEIYNASGIPVFQKTFSNPIDFYSIDIAAFNPGVYFISLKEKNTPGRIKKLVIIK